MWTVEKVKAELPRVNVRTAPKVIQVGKVTGRMNQFATVTVDYVTNGRKKHLHDWNANGTPWVDYKFSWQTIANSLNSDRPLSII